MRQPEQENRKGKTMRADPPNGSWRALSGNRLARLVGIAAVLLTATGPVALTTNSAYVTAPPTINGSVDATEWADAGSFTLPHGTVYFENDNSNLYLLYDMTGDPTLDTTPGALDSYEILFDVNGNGVGDSGQELLYAICNNGALANREVYLGTSGCNWTPCDTSAVVVARGFGTSPASATNHAIFEVAIPFSEIQGQAGKLLRVALGYYSTTPSFFELVPANMCAFASYLPLQLGKPSIPVLGRAGVALLALLLAGIGLWVVRRSLAG